jgi:hypothetical protein
MNYQVYLKSDKWKTKREEVLNDPYWGRKNQCLNCRSKFNLNVHHLNYERVGCEFDEDLCILCNKCHTKVHFMDGEFSNKNSGVKVFRLIFNDVIITKQATTTLKKKRKRSYPKVRRKYI